MTSLLKSKTLWLVLAACALVAVPLGFHFHWLTDHRQSQSEVADNNAFQTTTGLDDPDLTDSVIDEVVSSNLDIAVSDTPALFLDGSGAGVARNTVTTLDATLVDNTVRGSRSAFDAGT
ncbi:MAG: hypothetical protein IH991_12065, partial [Planctomycetes bacterium]|nr:hypothetical protein [Planctomycetota bacterium]